jgi:asparagine synthase (glutamine-hydrolysing)
VAGFLGGIVALGIAEVGCHRHVAAAIHGRIDNRDALAKDLGVPEGRLIEIVAEAYLRHGDGFASRLLGDFAILVLDERRGVLLGARDWVGARPLFWGERNGVVAFGSEVKQVLALLDRPYVLNDEVAEAYRTMQQPPVTATFARGVYAVAPSTQVLVMPGHRPRATDRPIEFEPLDLTISEAAELVRNCTDVAVQRRLHDARRPGAQISGGMDSTSAAATAASLAQRGLVAPLVAGFGLHFPDAPASDEIAYGNDLAEMWGIPWYPVAVSSDTLVAETPETLAFHDGPVYPLVQMFHALYATAQRLDIDVITTGLGGDYWQGQEYREVLYCVLRGEWRSAAMWLREYYRWKPRSVVRQAARAGLGYIGRQTESEHFARKIRGDWFIRVGYETEERIGQRHGVRVEFPFTDRELAGALVGLSPALRSSPTESKLPMRAAMAERLPVSILNRSGRNTFAPVIEAAYGPRQPSQTHAQMVAERYLETWREHLALNDSRNRAPVGTRPAS